MAEQLEFEPPYLHPDYRSTVLRAPGEAPVRVPAEWFHETPGPAFGRVTADYGNDALPLAVLQQCGRSGPLLLVKCPFESPLLVAMADLTNGLWS